VTEFTLPELGENVTTGDVLRVLVKSGDALAKDQPVLELETDKATIEVPSFVAGTVKDIRVKNGDKVKVGQTILTVDDGAATRPDTASAQTQDRESGGQPRSAQANAPAATAVSDAPGLEQRVEGTKRETADKPGVRDARSDERERDEPVKPRGAE